MHFLAHLGFFLRVTLELAKTTSRRINSAGLSIIKKSESFRSKPYICPAGWWTYGYGSIWDPSGARVTKDTPPCTQQQATELLTRDVGIAERAVFRYVTVPIDDNQFSALVSFTHNLGSGALQRSTLCKRLNRGDRAGAAKEFEKWCFGGGRKLPGLAKRRLAEKQLFLSNFQDDQEFNDWFNSMWGMQNYLQLTR